MKIIKVTSVHRNDFTAEMQCEGCGHESKLGSGYNDYYYHDTVIPNMKCAVCHMSRNEILKNKTPVEQTMGHVIE